MGIGSSLIYAPADYANTNELITICKVASKFKGKYISHMRNEGRNVLEAIDELITISKEAIFRLKFTILKHLGNQTGFCLIVL